MWDLIVSVPDHCLSFYFETTGNEVKTNTAERIRIAESISNVKRDLDIISEQLASNTEGRSLATQLRAAKSR